MQKVNSTSEHMKKKSGELDSHVISLNRNECNWVAQG